MPRSNKKKGTQNSQNAHLIPGHSTKKTNGKQPPETFTASSNAIALLFRREKKPCSIEQLKVGENME